MIDEATAPLREEVNRLRAELEHELGDKRERVVWDRQRDAETIGQLIALVPAASPETAVPILKIAERIAGPWCAASA